MYINKKIIYERLIRIKKVMNRKFDENFKKNFMKMKVGEDWNKLKEKYKDISQFQWDEEMKKHFNVLLEKYSSFEDYRNKKTNKM